jgi:hypothetical protein
MLFISENTLICQKDGPPLGTETRTRLLREAAVRNYELFSGKF